MTLKGSILLGSALGALLACGTASADVIHLKDGRQITATILKHAEDRITIDWFGTPLTYWLEEIERIDERDSPVAIPHIQERAERPARADTLAHLLLVDEIAAKRMQLITRVLYLSGLAQQIEQMPVQATAQLDERDEEALRWVQLFNRYDLYSKSDREPDWDALRPYYRELVAEFLPDTLQW